MTRPDQPGFWAALKGLLKTIAAMAGGVLVLLVVSLFFDNPLKVFFSLLSVAGTAMTVLSVASMLLTFRQAKALAPMALLLSLAVSLASTLMSLWLATALPPAGVLFAALIVGGGAGIGWSFTTLLFIDGNQVRGRGTLWYLLIWVLSFAANQLAIAAFGHVSDIMTVMMILSAGLSTGNTVGLLIRVRRATAFIGRHRPA
jgi:hypothetical protein